MSFLYSRKLAVVEVRGREMQPNALRHRHIEKHTGAERHKLHANDFQRALLVEKVGVLQTMDVEARREETLVVAEADGLCRIELQLRGAVGHNALAPIGKSSAAQMPIVFDIRP